MYKLLYMQYRNYFISNIEITLYAIYKLLYKQYINYFICNI